MAVSFYSTAKLLLDAQCKRDDGVLVAVPSPFHSRRPDTAPDVGGVPHALVLPEVAHLDLGALDAVARAKTGAVERRCARQPFAQALLAPLVLADALVVSSSSIPFSFRFYFTQR